MDKKEAREILIGRLVRLDDFFWAAAPADVKFHFHGVRDGAGDAFLFGVTHLTHCYQVTETDNTSIDMQAVETALYSMGRPIQLTSAPSETACLYAPTWIAPVLLSISRSKDEIQLSAYSGRSLLFGRLRCSIALWILAQRLPEGIIRLDGHKSLRKTTKEKTSKEQPAEKESSQGASAKNTPKKKAVPKRLQKKAPSPKRLLKK